MLHIGGHTGFVSNLVKKEELARNLKSRNMETVQHLEHVVTTCRHISPIVVSRAAVAARSSTLTRPIKQWVEPQKSDLRAVILTYFIPELWM